jgi:hypothetical protein
MIVIIRRNKTLRVVQRFSSFEDIKKTAGRRFGFDSGFV